MTRRLQRVPSRYGLVIRAAAAGDAEGLGELMRACGVTVQRDRLAANLSDAKQQPGAVLLAEEWGPPTGVLALHFAADLTAELKVAYVTDLLVDPERRRSGVARLLLKAAAQTARASGCGELILTAREEHDGLLAFALASGFSVEGTRLHRPLRRRD